MFQLPQFQTIPSEKYWAIRKDSLNAASALWFVSMVLETTENSIMNSSLFCTLNFLTLISLLLWLKVYKILERNGIDLKCQSLSWNANCYYTPQKYFDSSRNFRKIENQSNLTFLIIIGYAPDPKYSKYTWNLLSTWEHYDYIWQLNTYALLPETYPPARNHGQGPVQNHTKNR
jgi:hypothetical protein